MGGAWIGPAIDHQEPRIINEGMSMAVAVKNAPEATPRGLWSRLPVASLAGVVYVLASLSVAFSLVPALWQSGVARWLVPAAGEFINVALLGLVILAAVVGLVWLG